MATIVTRTGKGSALTFAEVDANFTNLNVETTDNTGHIATLTSGKLDKTGGTITGALAVNGNLTLGANLLASSVANSQSGATVTLTVPGNEVVRLTNSLLTQVSGIGAGSAGQKLIILNRTGTTVEFENESPSAALPADQMYTGTGGSLLLQNNAAISLVYDGTASRWNIIGGTGSGAGAGGINYILNPDAAVGITGYATYNDGTAVPVDGSGGTPPAGLWVRSTTTPLRGSGDFNLVKTGAVSYQGAGVAYDFTIDRADLAKVLTITFDYEVLSGTYASGDVAVYIIQDPAGTPVVIQPAGYQVQAATVGTAVKEIATFQTASNVTNYRLCIHVASASTQNYTLALDNISVGPQVVQYGAPVTDWQDYTPTITASVTNPTIGNSTLAGKWRRVGDSMQVQITWILGSTGASGSGVYNFSLPAGFSFDANKVSGSTTAAQNVLGQAFRNDTGTAFYTGNIYYQAASSVRVLSTADWSATFPHAFGSGDSMALEFVAPIQGWSSTVQMSNDTDTRVVAAAIKVAASTALTANTAISFTTTRFDTHAAWSTNTYTVPVSGVYRVSVTGWYTTAGTINMAVFVDGVERERLCDIFATAIVAGTTTISVNAGQLVTIRPLQSGTLGSAPIVTLSIERLSGPSAIAASETVAATYSTIVGTALGAGVVTKVPFATKEYDSHGAFVTDTFTAPVSGLYDLHFKWTAAAVTLGTGQAVSAQIFKNNSTAIAISDIWGNGASINPSVSVRYTARLLAGETIDFRARCSTATSIITLAGYNWFNITRVGNY